MTLAAADGSPIALQPELGDLIVLSATWTELDDSEVDASVTVHWQGGTAVSDTWTHGDDEGVVRMGALIDEIHAREAGADWCAGVLETEATDARIADAADRVAERAVTDPALQDEANLMAELLANVRGGLGNCAR